ncbi:type I-C CRISPR-associated protein Cas8c/Csd1 [uncultured Methylobacterium sp.]|uniref:type I-C CRISPR-associated protein Cas8c/Csd1 n=1 Tax=uncultured Methylobacterium sp. TaxID=157278 RepID=UPI0035CA5BB4
MTILAALARAYDRLADRREVPPFGYARTTIGFCVVLAPDGRPAFLPVDLRDGSGKRMVGARLNVPTPLVQRTSGIAPNFLWDKTAYSLGVTAQEGKRTALEHRAFVAFNRAAIASSHDGGLRTFALFLDKWQPSDFLALGWPEEMKDENVVFALEDTYREDFLHERPAAMDIWPTLLTKDGASEAVCLITGERSRIARSHFPIKGVWDAQSSGAYLVSYNASAFESYGHKEGDNAPVSEAAAFAYTSALNRMLERDSPNRIQIGDASTVFWADASGAEVSHQVVEAGFGRMMGATRIDEGGQDNKIRPVLERLQAGEPTDFDLALFKGVRFHVLALAPNAARLSVRFWLDDDFGEVARHYTRHVQAMRIAPPPREGAPSIWRCLIETAVLRKSENIPPNLAGEWLRAILTGRPYPRTLLATVLMRIRADGDVNALRVAMLKAVLIRNARKEVPVSLDPDNTAQGYLLGRLFATYERIQTEALPGLNATIRDKFYGSASATPRKTFPVLDRGSANHLAKLAKDKKGYAVVLERLLMSIMEHLNPDEDPFPAFLAAEQQSLFAVGYYHQKHEFFRRKDGSFATGTKEAAQ